MFLKKGGMKKERVIHVSALSLICSVKLLSPEVALYLYKSTILPCIKYCCHVWAGTTSCYLELLEKLLKLIYRTVGRSRKCKRLVFSIGITLEGVHLNWQNWFHFLILKGGLIVILIDCMIFLSSFLNITRMSMSTVSFLAELGSGILCL